MASTLAKQRIGFIGCGAMARALAGGLLAAGVDADKLLAAGRALESGARSDIIEGDKGYYVIMKTDSRPGGLRPLAEVQETLRRTLLREKKRELEERFVGESLDLAKVEMNTAAAREITLPVSDRQTRHQDQPPGFPGASQTTSATR